MYFDEEVILDLRLNILSPYIDYFIIVESSYTHKGDKRNLKFDIKKFDRFKEKIIYLTFDEIPSGIEEVFENDNEDEKSRKLILNAAHRILNIETPVFKDGLFDKHGKWMDGWMGNKEKKNKRF